MIANHGALYLPGNNVLANKLQRIDLTQTGYQVSTHIRASGLVHDGFGLIGELR
jgi:hypothetical protein